MPDEAMTPLVSAETYRGDLWHLPRPSSHQFRIEISGRTMACGANGRPRTDEGLWKSQL